MEPKATAMRVVTHPMIDGFTSEFLQVVAGEDGAGGAPHQYVIFNKNTDEILCQINLQHGNPQDVGVNGIGNQTLLLIVADFLSKVQAGEFRCRESAVCLTKTEEALQWSKQREFERASRGVLRTHKA